MLSKFINSQINNNINNINKLNHLNDKNKRKKKYNNVTINTIKFFEINKKIKLLDYITANDEKQYLINKNIKKINNVYKISYKNSDSSGFGDFIRGCYFLLQFCEKNNIEFDFYIYDNKIKYLLKYFIRKPNINNFIVDNINKYVNTNCEFLNINEIISYKINNKNNEDFINYLNNCTIYANNIFINTINFPSHNISNKHKNIIKQMLEPIEPLNIELNNIIKDLELEKNNFNVYHIRLGDKYIDPNNNNLIEIKVFNKILNNLNINNNEKYLLISDSVLIKNILNSIYPTIKTTNYDYSHTIDNDINKLKNTLLDFYLMSYSKNIISFSVYPHGTGFSKWCSVTYEIPYVCYSLF